jgi:hypothetical protein
MPRKSKSKQVPDEKKKTFRKVGSRWIDVDEVRKLRAKAKAAKPKVKKTPTPVYSRVYIISDTRANLDPIHRELKKIRRLHCHLYRVNQKDLNEIAAAGEVPLELVYFGDNEKPYLIRVQLAGVGTIAGDDYAAQLLNDLIDKQKTPLIQVWIHHEVQTTKLDKSLAYAGVEIRDKV